MGNPNIPVGISDFKEIRENNNYYIDKSGFISELLTDGGSESNIDYQTETIWENIGHEHALLFL